MKSFNYNIVLQLAYFDVHDDYANEAMVEDPLLRQQKRCKLFNSELRLRD